MTRHIEYNINKINDERCLAMVIRTSAYSQSTASAALCIEEYGLDNNACRALWLIRECLFTCVSVLNRARAYVPDYAHAMYNLTHAFVCGKDEGMLRKWFDFQKTYHF